MDIAKIFFFMIKILFYWTVNDLNLIFQLLNEE